MVEGDVFLLAVTGEGLVDVDFGSIGLGDGDGAIAGAGVDDDDFVCPADAFEGAGQVGFLVEGDHGYGQGGCGAGGVRRRWFGYGHAWFWPGGGLFDGELLLDEVFDEGDERGTVPGEDEVAGFFGPVELVAGGEGGDPDLADGGVGGDNELCAGFLKEDVDGSGLFFGLEAASFFGFEEGFHEGLKGAVGVCAESGFVEHTKPVYRLIRAEL